MAAYDNIYFVKNITLQMTTAGPYTGVLTAVQCKLCRRPRFSLACT